jgi:integrative and conjugative element protein (TIGR02256 family)
VSISDVLAEEIREESERFAPLETGGVVLGWREGRGMVLRVAEIVAAGPGARRERSRFEPDGPWQRARIAELYEASGRTLSYLGDWHSHPKGGGPSSLDRSTARRIAATPQACCSHPVLLIATCVDGSWALRAFRLATRRLSNIPVIVNSL